MATNFGLGELTPATPMLYEMVAWLLTDCGLLLVLLPHLLPGLILTRALRIIRIHRTRGRLVAVGIVAFGVPGLVAAPIYYAYVKDELVSRNLV